MIPIDDEILFGHIEAGHHLWLNKEAGGLALADWLAESVEEFKEEWGLSRNSFLGKVHNQWGGSTHFKTLQNYELLGRRWSRERRAKYPNLSLTHFRRIGDDEELAEKANRLDWTVEDIEEAKVPSHDGKLTTKKVKALIIEYDELYQEMNSGHTWNGESATLKAKKWEQIMIWAKG